MADSDAQRAELANVFYGEGPVPPPWATDCPIKFEVWLDYAHNPLQHRADLILALGEQHSVAEVFRHVSQFGGMGGADRRPVLSGGYIAIGLTFDDLVTMVMPLTSLGRKIGSARHAVGANPGAPAAVLAGIIAGATFNLPDQLDSGPPSVWEAAQLTHRATERQEHLRWFLRMLAAVVDGSGGAGALGTPATVWDLLQKVPVTQQTLPTVGQAATIDRRARHPVRAVTLNRPVIQAVSESRLTIKADAAEQLFGVDCSEIGWAVIDSGIDAMHPAFALRPPYTPPPGPTFPTRVAATYDLTQARAGISPDTYGAIIDWAAVIPHITVSHEAASYRPPIDAHGTHVAGVLGADWQDGPTTLRGVAPSVRLYDFRVFDGDGGDEFEVIAALQLIRFLNEQSGTRLIHGVNLSLSLRHDLANYSCGWTPICEECDRLVRSGVVVVAAAGNAGFRGGDFATGFGYNTVSITDPGNADAVITVGATHRSHPHKHGVSYFSSRGPTADGRVKPDLLAPGEDIDGPVPGGGLQAMHGTSQAAAHVSGAAAILMARYRELRGRPERVKELLCSTATDLGREPFFQGHGLVDVLRAMQAI